MKRFISAGAATTVAAAVVLALPMHAVSSPPPRDTTVTVIIENLAPPGGTYLTPVWVGFHDGGFDLYDGGAPISPELERLAEDGNTAPLMAAFDGVQATILSDTGIPPLAPGETATMTFTLDGRDHGNRYFSYASMVIPSNDAFIANGDPRAHKIFNNGGHLRGADFVVYGVSVNDAGSELNDEAPENTAFFGQQMPDTGQDEVVGVHDHVGYKFPGGGGILDDAMFANADFKADGYAVARITIFEEGDDNGDDD
jgi:hypothetical protein